MRQFFTTRNIIIISAIALAPLGYIYYKGRSISENVTYRFTAIERGNIVASVSATGSITPLSTVIVGSQMSGQIVEVLADYNSEVEAGQI